MMKHLTKALGIAVLACHATLALAQNIDPWLADGLNRQIRNSRSSDMDVTIRQAQERAQRQWQRDEDAIQAQIAKWRATPYYGAIAFNYADQTIAYGGGGNISREIAEKKALKHCNSPSCKIINVFANTCSMISAPEDNSEFFFFQ